MATAKKQKSETAPKAGQSGSVAVQPRTSAVLRWSPDRLTQVEQRADRGDFSLLGDLCETMMADDRVSQAQDRLFSATTLPLCFKLPGVDSEQSKNDPACVALEYDWWKMLPEGTIREIVAWLSLARICLVHVDGWDLDQETGRAIPRLTVWSIKHLRNDPDKGWAVRTSHPGSAWSADEEPLNQADGSWILLVSGSSWRAVMTAPWRGVSRFWLVKAYATVDWPNSSERHGSGTLVIWNENPEIAYRKEDRDKLVAQIEAGGRNKTIALPDGFKAALLLDTANTWTTFKAQVEVANVAISLAIVGTNLTTEVKGGSLAAASVHQDVDASKFRGVLNGIATGIHDKLLVFWGRYNFGSGQVIPYPEWDTKPPADVAAEADIQVKASLAVKQWQDVGINPSRKWVTQKWGVVEAESEEDTLTPKAQPAPVAPVVTPDPKSPPPKPTKKAQAQASAELTAFEKGRAYTDELETNLCRHAAKGLSSTLAGVLSIIESAEGFTDAQEKLKAFYADKVAPAELLKLTEAALIMAEMAGRETVEIELETEE